MSQDGCHQISQSRPASEVLAVASQVNARQYGLLIACLRQALYLGDNITQVPAATLWPALSRKRYSDCRSHPAP
jgi:hypothetical protein